MIQTYSLDDLLTCVRQGHRAQAVAILNHVIEADEERKDTWMKYAALAIRVGEFEIAKQAADRYRGEMPKTLRHLINYCGVYAEAGDLNRVLKLVEPQIKKGASDPNLFHLAGTVAAQLGLMNRAKNYLITALKLFPQSGITWFTLSSITNYKNYPQLLEKLEQAFREVAQTEAKNRQQFGYSLGKAYADMGRFEDAYKAYAEAASIMQQQSRYSIRDDQKRVEDIITNFSAEAVAKLPVSRNASHRTVALLGLPRSGTTLLGQMLAAQSKVKAAGETGAIRYSCMHLHGEKLSNFPSFIEQHGDPLGAIEHIGAIYSRTTDQKYTGTALVIDKTIELSRYFAIWAQAFPQGRAVYIEREPEDVAWSCFKSNFRSNADWSWSAKDIACYMANEKRLMQHWLDVFGERILRVRYEDLCHAPEQTLKRVCAHIGIDFEPQMLNFYKDNGPVFTSSVGQVHEPLNQKHMGQSRHYPSFIGAWRKSSNRV